MTLAFMVIGLPRSATTWAANWLTTTETHCVHDPLRLSPMEGWDALAQPGKRSGVACTAGWTWPETLNAHPARKLVLHRDLSDVTASLARLGYPAPDARLAARLDQVAGLHVAWSELFDPDKAATIWAQLIGSPFDAARHAALREIRVEPKFEALTVRPEAARKLARDLRLALQGA
jgi:hypothetical protein